MLGFRCYEGGGNIWGERMEQQTPGQRAAPDRTERGIEMEALLGEMGTALPSAGMGFLCHMPVGRDLPRFPCWQKLGRPPPGIPLAVGELACWPVGDPVLLAPVCWAPAVPGPAKNFTLLPGDSPIPQGAKLAGRLGDSPRSQAGISGTHV